MRHEFQVIFHCAELLKSGTQPSRCVNQFTENHYLELQSKGLDTYQFIKKYPKENNIYCNQYILVAWFYITKRENLNSVNGETILFKKQ